VVVVGVVSVVGVVTLHLGILQNSHFILSSIVRHQGFKDSSGLRQYFCSKLNPENLRIQDYKKVSLFHNSNKLCA
jgi:hypothetical protein